MTEKCDHENKHLGRVCGASDALTDDEIFAGVTAFALEHYNDGGWDVVVETYTAPELAATVREMRDGVPATTVAEAIAAMEPLVGIWADRQADAINSAF
jgi:hypothetical protein